MRAPIAVPCVWRQKLFLKWKTFMVTIILMRSQRVSVMVVVAQSRREWEESNDKVVG